MIVANNVDGDEMGGTLGEKTDVKIPVVSVSKDAGERLRAQPGDTTIKLNAGVRTERTRNVIAQTKTGSTTDVVMVGAHLDSVPRGRASTTTAPVWRPCWKPQCSWAVRRRCRTPCGSGSGGPKSWGWWDPTDTSSRWTSTRLKDIALYLNFDMVGSPNPGYFTYDGDQSAPPDPREAVPRVPEGSAGIERTLVRYLKSAGKPPEDTNFDGRSDYDGFTQAGVPAGGMFSGAETKMSGEQAERWGGEADQPFDPNYHKKSDTLDHIDRTAMEINGGGVAYAVGLYAQDQGGRNGVPVRDDRTRHVVTDS